MGQPKAGVPHPHLSWSSPVALALLALLGLAASLAALRAPFIWDDHAVIKPSPGARQLRQIPSFFGIEYWKSASRSARAPRPYRPIRETLFTVLCAVGGARVFHLAAMVLHVANVLLLFLLVLLTLKNRTLAFLSAALFALHPVHAEALVWAKNVSELVAFFLLAIAMLLFLAWEWPRDVCPRLAARRGWLYVGSLAVFALALGAKESALALPLLLLLFWLLWPERTQREGIGRRVLNLAPFFALALIYGLFQLHVMASGYARRPPVALMSDPGVRLALATECVWHYLRLLAAPVGLKNWYKMALPGGFAMKHGILLASVLGAAAAAVVLRRNRPAVAFGLLWTLLGLGPVANLVGANLGRPVADQRLYTPSAGWCVLVAAAWLRLVTDREAGGLSGVRRTTARIALGVLLGVFLVMTWLSAAAWHHPIPLFRRMVRWSPEVSEAQYMLGRSYLYVHREAMALEYSRRACSRKPWMPGFNSNHGWILRGLGRHEEAIVYFRRAIKGRPDHMRARGGLARSLADADRLDEALSEIHRAIEMDGGNPDLHNVRGGILARQGKTRAALACFQHALTLDDGYVATYCNLGNAFLVLGQYEDAREAHLRAVRLAPGLAEAHAKLGLDLAYLGRYAEAVQALARALALDPKDFEARHTLAKVYATQKRFDQAAEAFEICLAAPKAASLSREEKLNLLEQAADTFEKAEWRENALAQWREIMELDPNHPRAAEAMRRLGARGK